jgi:hypothetical protein
MMTSKDQRSALILKKIASNFEGGVHLRWFDGLPSDLREIAYLVFQVSDPSKRQARLRAELVSRGKMDLLAEIDRVDPDGDLSAFEAEDTWKSISLVDTYQKLDPLRWVLKPLFSRPSVSIFFGSPKGLKSMLLMEGAICIAAGKRWLTNPDNSGGFAVETCPTAWLDLENGSRRIRERASAFGRGRSLSDGTPFFRLVHAFSLARRRKQRAHGESCGSLERSGSWNACD